MRPRVFIVQAVPEEALQGLQAVASVEVFDHLDRLVSRQELLRAVRTCQYLWVLGEVPVDAEVMDAADLRLIAIMEIVSRSVDIAAATERGIPVTTLPNLPAVTTSTAEHTLALILALARRLPEAEAIVRGSRWRQYQSMALLGTRLAGKTLGIVGLGNVGRRVASYGRALGMQVVYSDRTRLIDAESSLGAAWRTLEALFEESDVIVVSATLTTSSRGLIDQRLLGRMRPQALFVNTARGQIVDEAALVDLLRERRIRGAALDVFAHEPPMPGGGPHAGLLDLDNVILTPHLGTATWESRIEMARTVADDIVAAIEGRRPPHIANPQVYGDPTPPSPERIA